MAGTDVFAMSGPNPVSATQAGPPWSSDPPHRSGSGDGDAHPRRLHTTTVVAVERAYSTEAAGAFTGPVASPMMGPGDPTTAWHSPSTLPPLCLRAPALWSRQAVSARTGYPSRAPGARGALGAPPAWPLPRPRTDSKERFSPHTWPSSPPVGVTWTTQAPASPMFARERVWLRPPPPRTGFRPTCCFFKHEWP